MKNRSSLLTRFAMFAFAGVMLTASGFAGPGPMPMYMMMGGKMYAVTPMAKDMTSKGGCKICTSGAVTMPGAKKPMMLKNGDMITAEGVMMKPLAQKAHGG